MKEITASLQRRQKSALFARPAAAAAVEQVVQAEKTFCCTL